MQLHERLMDLLGHEVAIMAPVDSGVKEVAAGSLKEVGPDYMIVSTGRPGQGDARGGGDWWIRSAMVLAVVHHAGCARCLTTD